MPELPEVQTIVNYLRKKIIGLRIIDVWVDWPKTVKQAGGTEAFRKKIKNKEILSVSRRAKYIVIDIDGEKTIFIHQKISGHMLYGKWKLKDGKWEAVTGGSLKNDPKNRFIRLIFFLDNGYQLALSDLRRFAKVLLVDDAELKSLKDIKELGSEPLDRSFTPAIFKKMLAKKSGRIKTLLMNQTFVAGIGNIYSDEILWYAGIHPLRNADTLTDREIEKIYSAIKFVLKKGIVAQGDSMDDYRLPSGEKGRYQEMQKAYQMTGKKCQKRDKGIIKRIKIGGRSAHFCPVHQK